MFTYKLDDDSELLLMEARHAEELYELVDANREHLRQWLPWVDGEKSPEDGRIFIQSMLRQFAYTEGLLVAIMYQGKIAGSIGLHDINQHVGTAQIGYWLGKEYEGKGLMTKACLTLMQYGFESLNLNRIMIRVEPENTRSRAIPRRLGYHYEGTMRKVGQSINGPVDLEIYSMLRHEWDARKQS